MIWVATCIAFVLRNGSWYRGRNIVVIVLCVDSCVQYEVDHVERSMLLLETKSPLSTQSTRSSSHLVPRNLPRFFTLSLARFRLAHFANGRSPLSGTKQRRKLRKERQKKKKRTKREAGVNSTRETICEATRKRDGERRGGGRKGGREKEHAHRAGT